MATYNPAPILESDTSARAQLDPANPSSQQNLNSTLDGPSHRVQERDSSREGGSHMTGQQKFAQAAGAQVTQQTAGDGPMPPSTVADYDYPNVPETTEPQQAASGPGTGQTVDQDKVPFKEQVHGYAKKIHGQVFGNPDEKEFGEKKLAGEL